jgi:hypothetical protein
MSKLSTHLRHPAFPDLNRMLSKWLQDTSSASHCIHEIDQIESQLEVN